MHNIFGLICSYGRGWIWRYYLSIHVVESIRRQHIKYLTEVGTYKYKVIYLAYSSSKAIRCFDWSSPVFYNVQIDVSNVCIHKSEVHDKCITQLIRMFNPLGVVFKDAPCFEGSIVASIHHAMNRVNNINLLPVN